MGLFFEILSIVLWRSFDVLGQFTREARARLHAPSERLVQAAIAFPAAGLGGRERGVRQGRGRGQPVAVEQIGIPHVCTPVTPPLLLFRLLLFIIFFFFFLFFLLFFFFFFF